MNARMKYILNEFEKNQLGPDEPFKFHCTMCGKCCIKREDILLNPRDMYNLAKELGMTPHEVMNTYCETYIGGDSRLPVVRLKPRGEIRRCPLLKDRKCSVHNSKPTVCALFPIGRGIAGEKGNIHSLTVKDIRHFFSEPGCGDDSETHTVREWLGEFGFPLEDEFFFAWNHLIAELGSIFRAGEQVLSERTMSAAWQMTFVKIYLDYDLGRDFMQQFQANAEEVLDIMRRMPAKKDKKKGGK